MSNSISLPPNVSGFHNPETPAPSLLDVNEIQNFCEVVTEGNGYRFIQFLDLRAQKNRSYHLAIIGKEQKQFLIFFNKYRKVIAFSEVKEDFPKDYTGIGEMPRNEYLDLEDLEKAFGEHYMVLPVHILMMPLDSDLSESAAVVKNLEDTEFGEFSFWVPQTIGQVVFNSWDKKSD